MSSEDFNFKTVIPEENKESTINADKAREDFKRLYSLNLNSQTETKSTGGQSLTYLNWASAWKQMKLAYGNPSFRVIRSENGKLYHASEMGVFVIVEVSAGGMTYQQHLPVLDAKNMPMKLEPYEYSVYNRQEKRYEKKTVNSCTVFDINSAIQRALVKCISLYGIGLYIYEGNDLPNQLPSDSETEMIQTPVEPDTVPFMEEEQPVAPKPSRKRRATKEPADPIADLGMQIASMQTIPELVNLYKIHAHEVSTNPEVMAMFSKRRHELEKAA